MPSFSVKALEIDITPASGGAKNLRGLACDARITKPGLPDKNSAVVNIWGMRYEDIARLTVLGPKPLESDKNLITVRAGEEGGELAEAFSGEIIAAYADFNASPDVVMRFEAMSGGHAQQMAAAPLSVRGETPVSRLIEQFAGEMGYAFRNEGVTASVRNAVFNGSPLHKAREAARQINAELFADDGVLVLLPKGQAHRGSAVPISAATGLLGYPTFNQDGLICRCLYNPNLKHGGLVQVRSLVPGASGSWRVTKLSHSLSAWKSGGGPWESHIEAEYV